jgi:hypothetical protein
MTKEGWNTVHFTLEHSQAQRVGVGSLGRLGHVPLGVNTPRVHYDNGLVLVEVRSPGEWHEVREFIQPANPDVVRIVRSLYG